MNHENVRLHDHEEGPPTRHGPRCWRVRLLLIAVPGLAWAYDPPPHQTHWREERGLIPSALYETRFDPPAAAAVTSYRSWSNVGHIRWEHSYVGWSPDIGGLDPKRSGSAEERLTLGLRTQQRLGSPVALEWDINASYSDLLEGMTWSDLRASILYEADRARYGGAILGLGVTIPLGDHQDWLASHGRLSKDDGWGGLALARVTAALGRVGFHGAARYTLIPQSSNQTRPDLITGQRSLVKAEYHQLELDLAGSIGVGAHLTLGSSLRLDGRWWNNATGLDLETGAAETSTHHNLLVLPLALSAAWTPAATCRVAIEVGYDLLGHELQSSERWRQGIQFAWVF